MKHLSHSKLSPASKAIAEHLHQHGPASLDELLEHFPAEGRGALRRRLNNMLECLWLDISWDAAGKVLWHFAARARVPRAAQPQGTPPVPQGLLVPPRRINVMVGTYTPPPMAPARPGALDYQRCASQGVRC